MKEVYRGFEWADAVLIGTPVYQGTLSGQLKVPLDRMRAFAASKQSPCTPRKSRGSSC
ncbi:MAG: NAD(P)H-dependent oxidoreductase [Halobacteriota archaeon]